MIEFGKTCTYLCQVPVPDFKHVEVIVAIEIRVLEEEGCVVDNWHYRSSAMSYN